MPYKITLTSSTSLLRGPVSGRLLIALNTAGSSGEPRGEIGNVRGRALIFGHDVKNLAPGQSIPIDLTRLVSFPDGAANQLPAAKWQAQAVLATNPDLRDADAPGNLVSDVVALRDGATISFSRRLPAETMPRDTADVRYLKFRSDSLSAFWKRPIFLRTGVVLPPNFASEPSRRYGLRVHIGGFGSRYTGARSLSPHPDLVQIHLDGDGPLGDPYQVDSANNGPFGRAITTELIPEIERKFRCGGREFARFTDGGSTGGWVSLALQMFYPDLFGGCFSGYPDPLDFRDYETINLYADDNAYAASGGAERASMRDSRTLRTLFSIRAECQMENVLGHGDSYTTSGGQWGAWNATFGPRGADNRPVAFWNPKTGKIDKRAVESARKYDLRACLEVGGSALAKKLAGKLHIWVGDADDYFLDAGVRKFDAFVKVRHPELGAKILFGPGQGHGWAAISERAVQNEMAARFNRPGGG